MNLLVLHKIQLNITQQQRRLTVRTTTLVRYIAWNSFLAALIVYFMERRHSVVFTDVRRNASAK